MCQHDFEGRRIFQHRNMDKWNLLTPNKRIPGFLFEEECINHVDELRKVWNGNVMISGLSAATPGEIEAATHLTTHLFDYQRVGYDRRQMSFRNNGLIGRGSAGREVYWGLCNDNGTVVLDIRAQKELTCRLKQTEVGLWEGSWVVFEKMPVQLKAIERWTG